MVFKIASFFVISYPQTLSFCSGFWYNKSTKMAKNKTGKDAKNNGSGHLYDASSITVL